MPAITALTIKDGATVPVDKTFGVVSTNGSRAQWAERSAQAPAGFMTISHEVREPSTPSASKRVIISGNFPVLATDTNGNSVVARYSSVKLEINFSNLSTEAERKDVSAYLRNFLSLPAVIASLTTTEPFY
jgi:hypothetical protein